MKKQNVIKMQQVHGNNVTRVDSKDVGTTISNCDALITNDPGVTLCVRVADCLAISVIDQKGRGIGLIHAGWRGLENGIIWKTIEKMNSELQITNSQLKVKIGPHICLKHYEVKTDVSEKFSKYPNAILRKDRKEFLDLAEVAVSQLVNNGIARENITSDKRCTYEDESLYSYRRNMTLKRNLIMLEIDNNY